MSAVRRPGWYLRARLWWRYRGAVVREALHLMLFLWSALIACYFVLALGAGR